MKTFIVLAAISILLLFVIDSKKKTWRQWDTLKLFYKHNIFIVDYLRLNILLILVLIKKRHAH